ncbi:MAG: phosphoribosyltransferase family protein [Bacteroidota bacterium]
MTSRHNLILSESQVRQITKRIAYEIYERNFYEKELVIVGIYEKGYKLAQLIINELKAINGKQKSKLVRLDINKQKPLAEEVKLDVPLDELKGLPIILVDDVQNTGRTFSHSLKALLEVDIKKLETAVLVNRSHKLFPILASYTGYELSTTIDEHVEVVMNKEIGVYLH